jgi:enoyl-CoA hydratase
VGDKVAADIFFHVNGPIGVVTLNREKALNALTKEMVYSLLYQLHEWQHDPVISVVIIKSTSERAFCAGGDIRELVSTKQSGQLHEADNFYFHEYQLNYLISIYPKVYISFINGICMGGGMGISQHGKFRIITSETIMAMPETGIGFFPDVGAGTFLAKLPDNLGMYLGLTGAHISASDSLWLGLATHKVEHKDFWNIENQISELFKEQVGEQMIHSILDSFHTPSEEPSQLELNQEKIETFFSAESLENLMSTLSSSKDPWALEVYEQLQKKSPLSLKVTFEYMKKAKRLSLRDIFKYEYRLSHHFLREPEFEEGVRALLIDKDHKPKWAYPSLKDISDEKVKSFFEPLAVEWNPQSGLTNLEDQTRIEMGVFN